jgi:hypothetical protein
MTSGHLEEGANLDQAKTASLLSAMIAVVVGSMTMQEVHQGTGHEQKEGQGSQDVSCVGGQ